MCGIIGYSGPRKTTAILMEGLRRLEYRGYDSAGIALGTGSVLTLVKSVGKISALKAAIPLGLEGSWGIGHTRWATH